MAGMPEGCQSQLEVLSRFGEDSMKVTTLWNLHGSRCRPDMPPGETGKVEYEEVSARWVPATPMSGTAGW